MPPRIGKNARGKTAPPIKKDPDAVKDPQQLAPKDAALLAQVFQQYEEKKYSAAIKTADLILKKTPNHAQTMCMKGLSTYNIGKREEGRELAKRALAIEVTSHVCWHVNALIHRADREYTEALKCYIQANKVEPNDLNVLRDLINVQLFLRQYDGACVSRLNLLRLQPRLRYSWTALAVAHHLNGDYARADELLQIYCDMLDSVPANDYDYSEVILYRIQVALEAKKFTKAAEVLEKDGRRIVDLQTKKEFSAQIQLGLGKSKAAELAYQELLDDNSDQKQYLSAYLATKDIDLTALTESNRTAAIDALQILVDRYPKSRMIRRAMLEATEGDLFRKRVGAYIAESLTKGIPSLFSDLKRLLDVTEKREIIYQTAQSMQSTMEAGKTIEGDDVDTESEEAPTTYIWLLYLIAQIELHLRLYTEALQTIDKAIAHTPVLPELWMAKARIQKRYGNTLAAEDAIATARFLDGQDRYLNGKHCKYLLRIDEVDKAEQIAGIFTRKDAETPLQDLTDMQCLWFLLEEGDSYRRQGKLGLALKRYHTIEKIFSEMFEDEFDFHGYCMRKFTLRACINMIRSNNMLRRHPAFLAAARGAIAIYLQLHNKPYEEPVTNGAHHEANGESEEDRRKAEKKAKKMEAKAKAAAEEAKKLLGKATGQGKQKQDDEDEIAKDTDQDPTGEKLWKTSTALQDVEPFLKHLELLGQDRVEALELVSEVCLQRGEFLRALRAIQQLKAIAPTSPSTHLQTVLLATTVQTSPAGPTTPTKSLLDQHVQDLVPLASMSLENYNTQILQSHSGNVNASLAAAKAQWAIAGRRSNRDATDMLLQGVRAAQRPTLADLQKCVAFMRDELKADPQDTEALLSLARSSYPDATAFKTSEDVDAQKRKIAAARQAEQDSGNEASR